MQHDFEAVPGRAERLQRAAHARDVAVMVRAPHVDQQVVAALPLVEVIGDVGGEVGLLAIGADHHAVFVVAEFGGLEPLGAVLGVHAAGLARSFVDATIDGAALVQLALRVPVIEAHAEFLEIVADVGQHGVAREEHDGIELRAPINAARILDESIDVFFLVAGRRVGRRAAMKSAARHASRRPRTLQGVAAQLVQRLDHRQDVGRRSHSTERSPFRQRARGNGDRR